MKCVRCGEEYEKDEVCITFADINRVPMNMCEECLDKAYEDGEPNLFYDTCEDCGKDFDVIEEDMKYSENVPWEDGLDRNDYGRILCAACALEAREHIEDDN